MDSSLRSEESWDDDIREDHMPSLSLFTYNIFKGATACLQ